MELDLKRDMENLKNITCELIDKLNQDDYEALQDLMDKRQKLLDDLQELHCTKEQYGKAAEEFEIIYLQNKLFKLMAEKKHDLREKIGDISKRKALAKGYNRHIGASIFSKKI